MTAILHTLVNFFTVPKSFLIQKSPYTIVFLFSSICFSQNLSLSDAQNHLLENNGKYRAAVLNTEKVLEQKKERKGLRYPSLNISATYLHLQDDISVDLNPQRDKVAGYLNIDDPAIFGDWRRVLQGQDFAFASASIKWPLFTGGRINATNQVANIQYDQANSQQDLQKNQLTVKLIENYYGLKLMNELVKLRKEILNMVKLHKERADKFFANGLIAEVETLNAEVAMVNAQRDLIAAQKDKELATTGLNNLINFKDFDTLSTPFKIPEILSSLQDYQEKMLRSNVQINILNKNEEMAEIAIKAEEGTYFPNLAAMGNYRFFNENLALGQVDWYVGLGLEWNLFNGFQREHKIKSAKLGLSQVGAIKSQVEMDLLAYTEKLYRAMEKQFEMYQSLKKEEELAEKLKFMRDRSFEEGLGTSLEVIDATVKLSSIRFQKLQTLYEFSKTKGELMVNIRETNEFLQE